MELTDSGNSIISISKRGFEIYALSLDRGHDFESREVVSCFQGQGNMAAGCILLDHRSKLFTSMVMRRRVDHCWTLVDEGGPWRQIDDALEHLKLILRASRAPEPLPPGRRRRPLFLKPGSKGTGEYFDLLNSISHIPALLAMGECYLALPNPDENFVTDLQTTNFSARLFELYLCACFREQGVEVSQEYVSPDFRIRRGGIECWIEAVTAHSDPTTAGRIEEWVSAPEDPIDRMTGDTAERFAKTLRSKLQRNYHEQDHVTGHPFAVAIADFHQPGSMRWSREALPTYLYGMYADTAGEGDQRHAIGVQIDTLEGESRIPAGLFRNPDYSHLSAVIFSNGATLGKFNRMGFLAGWRPASMRMVRSGLLYDRTPGALEPIYFSLSLDSPAYGDLWPEGECWSQELEVFHNPLASKPLPFELIPRATHWFENNGDIQCQASWANFVLSSETRIDFDTSD